VDQPSRLTRPSRSGRHTRTEEELHSQAGGSRRTRLPLTAPAYTPNLTRSA
jgi:hypothetical protein